MSDPKIVNNGKFLLKDLIEGDEAIAQRADFQSLTGDDVREAIELIVTNENLSDDIKKYILLNSWKVHYKRKPPTIQEFLSYEWLGPTALSIYPHVRNVLENFWNPVSKYRHLVLAPAIGYGKMGRNDTKVFTPSGYKLMGDIKVGDTVATPNGKTATVVKVFPQGVQDIYEVTFRDGRQTYVGKDHLWKVTMSTTKKTWVKGVTTKYDQKGLCIKKSDWQIKTTEELMQAGLKKGKGSPKWKIPLTKPVYHIENKHHISPYILGVLIGDGYLPEKHSLNFTTKDSYIVDRVKRELPLDTEIGHKIESIQYRIVSSKKVKEELKRLNLLGKLAQDKYIPKEYLFDSVDNRIALLQGLMDTDGCADKNGRIRFDTTSEQLRDNIITLSRGLGGTASWKAYSNNRKNKSNGSTEFIVFIQFPNNDFPIFGLKRKQERVDANFDRERKRRNTQLLSILDIKKVDKSEATCIMLDDLDHLYLTDEYIVTHNSTLSVISVLYINTHLNLMRSPKRFFGLNESVSISSALVSFSLDKAKQVLLQPFHNILESSPKFHRVRQEDYLEIRQKEYPDKVAWTTASRVGSIQFSGGMHILIASNPAHILGLTLICGVLSELSFFIDQGVSAEDIWRVYSDTKGRIYSRFGNKYFATSIIDSSPNDMELSPIDQYIFSGRAEENPTNYVVTGTHWDALPDKYPIWQTTGETFDVFKGSGSKPPKIVVDPKELDDYNQDDVYHVPIDVKQKFVDDIMKSVKDYCGWPSGSSDKLIDGFEVIDNIFDDSLRNTYTYIQAPASLPPERLIWDRVYKDFFIELGPNNYEFYRAARETRYLHIDQSINGDVTSITMVHPEINQKGEVITVIDFTIVIIPKNDKINLDAIIKFILDLRNIGKINIGLVTFDQFQSANGIQVLEREEIPVELFSVDRDKNPYYLLASHMKTGRVKGGRNIFLKNNLKSLILVKNKNGKIKVDHKKGDLVYDDGANWDSSLMGINAKDVSDTLAGAVDHVINLYKGVPRYAWIAEEVTINSAKGEDTLKTDDVQRKRIENAIKSNLAERFGLHERVV